ncbi:MAG: single-stranded DNA-binding protein [Acholeplasmatales bacterium]|nr:MAG: single-stranded DNA-binding protein [Acholeplasmatales bacterium]
MVNQVILVGRLVYDPELKLLDSGKKVATITLALQRSFKSADSGTYETDFIRCTLWSGIAENTVQYCKKGSTIGVKARLAQRYFEYGDEESFTYPEVVAEKVTFISPKAGA